MELTLKRTDNTNCTIGNLSINGTFECYTLEDVDRGLTSQWPIGAIAELKIHGKTAIPTGKYEVVIGYSERFKRLLPLLLNVPGFAGIRIHPGNGPDDTEGCILVGQRVDGSRLAGGSSRPAFSALFAKLQAAIKKEKIWIVIS